MNKKETHAEIKDEIGKIVLPIFNKVAQDKQTNPTSVGNSGSFSQYNLHNYRLYFSYRKPTQTDLMRSVGSFTYVGSRNYNSEQVFKHSSGYQVTIKKSQVELKKKHESRDWHLIDNSHPEEISKINSAKQEEAINIFREFVREYGGETDFNIISEYKIDNAIKNSLTRKIPIKEHWEDDVTKKLYKEDKIEAKRETYAKNFCHNAGLHDFSPEITQRLDTLSQSFTAIDLFTKQINLHLTAIQELRDAVKDLRSDKTNGLGERLGAGSMETPFHILPDKPLASPKPNIQSMKYMRMRR